VGLPRLAEREILFVHPDPQTLTPHLVGDAADGFSVLAVVTEEDVEGLGQRRPPGLGKAAVVYQEIRAALGFATLEAREDRTGIAAPETPRRPRGLPKVS